MELQVSLSASAEHAGWGSGEVPPRQCRASQPVGVATPPLTPPQPLGVAVPPLSAPLSRVQDDRPDCQVVAWRLVHMLYRCPPPLSVSVCPSLRSARV